MVSFLEQIEKKRESEAYCLGGDAFHPKYDFDNVVSPFVKDSPADKEWRDGFHDAWYIHIVTGG